VTTEERWRWAIAETANIMGRVMAGADLEQQVAESLNKAATPDPIVLSTPVVSPSELLIAVQSWQRLVEQLAPYAGKNDDPSDVLARVLREDQQLREQLARLQATMQELEKVYRLNHP